MQLAAAYRVEISKYQAEVWYEFLHDLPVEHVNRAGIDWIVSQNQFPSIAEFRRLALRLRRRERELRYTPALPMRTEGAKARVQELRSQLPEPKLTEEIVTTAPLPRTGGCAIEGPHDSCDLERASTL